MNKLDQKGFGLIEGLLILVAIIGLGFGGYYIYTQNTDDNGQSTSNELAEQDIASLAQNVQNMFPDGHTETSPSIMLLQNENIDKLVLVESAEYENYGYIYTDSHTDGMLQSPIREQVSDYQMAISTELERGLQDMGFEIEMGKPFSSYVAGQYDTVSALYSTSTSFCGIYIDANTNEPIVDFSCVNKNEIAQTDNLLPFYDAYEENRGPSQSTVLSLNTDEIKTTEHGHNTLIANSIGSTTTYGAYQLEWGALAVFAKPSGETWQYVYGGHAAPDCSVFTTKALQEIFSEGSCYGNSDTEAADYLTTVEEFYNN